MPNTAPQSAFGSWNDRDGYALFPSVRLHSFGGDQVLLCRVVYEPGAHVRRHLY